MTVYFVRHASAGQHKANAGRDEKRPLDREGVQQAHQLGRVLSALNVEVDVVISSPLKRAMQTASAIANELGYEQKIERDAALRPDATFDSFRHLLSRHQNKDALMVVGHNPTIAEFLSMVLSRGHSEDVVELRKGSAARVEMEGRKAGTLHWCVTPKLLAAAFEAAAPTPSRNGHSNGTRPASAAKTGRRSKTALLSPERRSPSKVR